MSNEFDPYYAWLGIPPDEQPANHYRLLGVRLFEDNADVISNAADQRMVYVRTFQSGQKSASSQKILNEISTAKICLLDPQKKAAYDLLLKPKPATAAARQSLPQARPIAMPQARAIPVEKPAPAAVDSPAPLVETSSRGSTVATKYGARRPKRSPVLLGVTTCITVLLIGAAVWYFAFRGAGSAPIVENNPASGPASTTLEPAPPTPAPPTPKIETPPQKPNPPPNAIPANPPAQPTPAASLERKRWRYDNNNSSYEFVFVNDIWHEASPVGQFRFLERARNDQFIELFDAGRNVAVRLYADHYELAIRGQPWAHARPGKWVAENTSIGGGPPSNAPPATGRPNNIDVAVGTTLDLIALYDPEKNQLLGQVKKEGATLHLAANAPDFAVFPVELPPQYLLEADVVRHQESDCLAIALQVGGQPAMMIVDGAPLVGWRSGLFLVGGEAFDGPNRADVHRGQVLPMEKLVSLRCTVLTDRVLLEADGRVLADWTGDPRQFTVGPPFAVADPRSPGIRSFGSIYEIRRLHLRPIKSVTLAATAKPPPPTTNPPDADDAREFWRTTDKQTGSFQASKNKLGPKGQWVESHIINGGRKMYFFTEKQRNPEFIEIFDDKRFHTVRLYTDRAEIRSGTDPNGRFDKKYDGGWTSLAAARGVAQNPTPPPSASTPPTTPPPAAVPPPPGKAVVRSPAPEADKLKAVLEQVKTIFKDQYANAKKPPEKAAFAKEMFDKGRKITDDPVARYVMLDQARLLAMEGGSLVDALQTIDEIGGLYEVDVWPLKLTAVEKTSAAPTTAPQKVQYAELAFGVADAAIDAERFDDADKVASLAYTQATAKVVTDIDVKRSAKEHRDAIQQLKKTWGEVQKALGALATNPDDPAANLTVGKFRCFRRNEWQGGLPHLAKAANEKLAAAAKLDVAAGTDAKAQLKAADAWEKAADGAKEDKSALTERAHYWYASAVANGLTGLEAQQANSRLAALAAAVPPPHPTQTITLLDGSKADVHPGLIGRMLVNGKDIGVLLKYTPGKQINPVVVQRIRQEKKAGGIFRIELGGYLLASSAGQMYFRQEGGGNAALHRLFLNFTKISVVDFADSYDSRTISVVAGRHRIDWQLNGLEPARQTELTVYDYTSNRGITSRSDSPFFYTKQMLDTLRPAPGKKGELRKEYDLGEN